MYHTIDRIEINYFRSIYKVNIGDISRLNIISGENDSGKSNVLKAMNLFFNGETDWGTPFSFYDNYSKKRLEEVRKESIKGKQEFWIAITFNRPGSYSGSLPEKFRVKKTWVREKQQARQEDNLESKGNRGKLPASNITVAKQSLTKFLNKIHFEYIPAVKGQKYYEDLLERLQKQLLHQQMNDNKDIAHPAQEVADNLTDQIEELKKDFKDLTNIDSRISPPEGIGDLYQSFSVSTRHSGNDIAMEHRGDGIQSQYLASVLSYIAQSTNNYHVWGFEEPENSLEYKNALRLSNAFKNRYLNVAQQFLTTHSPAFLGLDDGDDTVRLFRVAQTEPMRTNIENISGQPSSGAVDVSSDLSKDLGIVELHKEMNDVFEDKLEELKKQRAKVKSLETEIQTFRDPVLVTEGKHDVQILDVAWDKLFDNERGFKIRNCDPDPSNPDGGSGGATTLKRFIETVQPEDERVHIALFDRDGEGMNSFKKLPNTFENLDDDIDIARSTSRIKRHRNGYAFALLLPIPDYQFAESLAGQEMLEIEHHFPEQVLKMKDERGHGLQLSDDLSLYANGGSGKHVELDPETTDWIIKKDPDLSARRLEIRGGKQAFAENIVPDLDQEHFYEFEHLFSLVDELLNLD